MTAPGAARALEPVADVDLVQRMTRGDRAALAELYARHAPTLLALAHVRQDAEDLIHDVFLEAWQHSAEYSEARSSVRSWLLLRTRSRALDRLRSKVRRDGISAQTQTDDVGQDAVSVDSDRHRLPAALAQIPETQQDVIVLSYFEGLSTLEISSRLGIPAGTVKSRTHAAIATLRGALGVSDE